MAEYGVYERGGRQVIMDMNEEMRRVLRDSDGRYTVRDLKPDWHAQKLRVLVPCGGTPDYHWCRDGLVVTLGQLFYILGKNWTAAQIYSFYRTLRIVALKRRKAVRGGPRDQALPVTGSLLAGTAGARIKHELAPMKMQLVEEYATLTGEDTPTPHSARMDEMFDAAVRFLHMNLLQDLSPPWVTHEFLQALPGDGVLCRYTQPTFLRWETDRALLLFGDEVMEIWHRAADNLEIKVAGVLARPLYVCTQPTSDGTECMAVAAMSPLLVQRAPHRHFMCPVCKRNARNTPVSDSVPRRILRMYVLVNTVGDTVTVMRTAPLHVIIDAPAEDMQWGMVAGQTPPPVNQAHPTRCPEGPVARSPRASRRRMYSYTHAQSQAIWAEAQSYREAPR